MSKPDVNPTRTVKATSTDEDWPEDGYTTPGAVFVDRGEVYKDHLCFACPGCGQMGSIRATHPKDVNGPSWDIVSGSLLEPTSLTLSPSINCVGCCKWHGYLRAGVFESC